MKCTSFFFFIILLFSNKIIFSQDFSQKGMWEIGGRISFVSSTTINFGEAEENSLNTLSLHVPVYYFLTEGLEAGLIPGFQNISYGDFSSSLFELLAGIAYNFKANSTLYPYVEGQIGFNSSSNGSSRSGILWLLIGGLKVQVGGNALVEVGLFYEHRTLETSNNEDGRDGTNNWGIDAGFAVFFGG